MDYIDAVLKAFAWLWQSLVLPLVETFSLAEHYSECMEAVSMTTTSMLALLQAGGGGGAIAQSVVTGNDGTCHFAPPSAGFSSSAATTRLAHPEAVGLSRCLFVSPDSSLSDDAAVQRRFIRSQVGFISETTFPFVEPPMRSLGGSSRGKVLVLDLDETLIFASTSTAGMAVAPTFSEVVPTMSGATLYHVWERPHLQTFLSAASRLYSVVVFTAASQAYADPLLDRVERSRLFDGRRRIKKRLFRTECSLIPRTKADDGDDELPPSSSSSRGQQVVVGKSQQVWSKDLSVLRVPLDSVMLVDNSPCCLRLNPENGLLCPSFHPPRHVGEPQDAYLLNLLVLLEALYFVPDVRAILRLGTKLR